MNIESLTRKYVTGSINEKELATLRQAIADQPELRENLILEQTMQEYRNKRLKSELRNVIPQVEGKKSYTKILLACLAIMICLVGLGYWIYQNNTQVHTATHFANIQLQERSVSPVRLMSSNKEEKNIWSAAIEKYSKHDYDEAFRLIQTIENPTSEQKLYKGLCQIYMETPDYQAVSGIMKSLQSTEMLVYDQALWYGALVDIKLDNIEDANSQLTVIIENDLWKKEEAQSLLELLNK